MKKKFKKCIILTGIFCLAFSFNHTKCDENAARFTDVDEKSWYFTAVDQLVKNNVLEQGEFFYGDLPASRGDIINVLHRLDKRLSNAPKTPEEPVFSDVLKNSDFFDAVNWAGANGIVTGDENSRFNPEAQCSKEQLCSIAVRYLNLRGITPPVLSNGDQFADSLAVSDFARSYVTACKMSGIISGDEAGYFRPQNAVTRAETATVLYSLMNVSVVPKDDYTSFVSTEFGAYDNMYLSFKTEKEYFFTAYVEKTDPVDPSYFNDAIFVGDSVTMSLKYYCASSGALGKAQFLSAASLSPMNALWDVSASSMHPSYGGTKMKVEDAVAASGANKVYIMLGINSLANGVERNFEDMKALLEKISVKSPNAQIFVQSVTPMTSDSPITAENLNNAAIIRYNEKLLALCNEKGYYYLNVAEVMRSGDGSLEKSYCSDPTVMGIHFTFAADKIWCDYLKTHAPVI